MLTSITLIILPLFLIGSFGYGLRYFSIISNDGVEALGAFTFRIALPCTLIRLTATTSFAEGFPIRLILAYYVPLWILFIANYLVFYYLFQRNHTTRMVASLNGVFGNSVALGVPIALLLFDNNILPYLIMVTLHTPIIVFPSLIALDIKRQDKNPLKIAHRCLKTISHNPNLIAILIGLTINFLPLTMPSFIDNAFLVLQKSALPCALIAIGGSMVQYGIVGHLSQALLVSSIKTFILPASVFLSIMLFFDDLSSVEKQSLILLSCLPTGITPFLISSEYNNNGIRISTSTLFITACCSAFSVTLWLYLAKISFS